MSNDALDDLLPAIGVAAFRRRDDGAFVPLTDTPPWFARLAGDGTFPFLGHILEEASRFWDSPVAAHREWGPCAEVDDAGREFHYKVTAVIAPPSRYLVFQLDTGSDEMRKVLVKVREQMLDAEQHARELRAIIDALPDAGSVDSRRELAERLAKRCEALLRR